LFDAVLKTNSTVCGLDLVKTQKTLMRFEKNLVVTKEANLV
jgi:hypothetical protein